MNKLKLANIFKTIKINFKNATKVRHLHLVDFRLFTWERICIDKVVHRQWQSVNHFH